MAPPSVSTDVWAELIELGVLDGHSPLEQLQSDLQQLVHPAAGA